jgi:hypothetical protein
MKLVCMDRKEMLCEGVDCIHLIQDGNQWQSLCENNKELMGSIKGREFLNQLRDC